MTIITKETPIEVRETRRPVAEGERDTHAVGTTIGAAAGGIAGAAAGVAAAAATGLATGTLMGGPIGGAIGLVAGAVAGGVLGSAVGEAVNPTAEEQFWSVSYRDEPYFKSGYSFDDYRPAYRVGYEGYRLHPGKTYEEVEDFLRDEYIRNRGNSRLAWEDARAATRSAWSRLGSPNRGGVN